MPNRLVHENSPYLLQHAANPVDWHPWDTEALEKAKSENKPIFLSIGYAACHWCHVMAHESFEDPDIAHFMNEHFINIKVDREERPDIDTIYMNATVAMTGSGGWPTSVFLSPALKPFYAGTYFPPTRRYNLPSFLEILQAVASAWQDDPDKVIASGQKILEHLQGQTSVSEYEVPFEENLVHNATQNLLTSYDWGYGGWGSAPKFPQPMSIEFLMRRHLAGNEKALSAATHALLAMSRGGMYDVVGGGFSRYSTDHFWRVPHFEKMLYDNAQLARAYLHAWQISGNAEFRRVAMETLDFIEREMTNADGGFYSSQDADSEGEEGKFYVWTSMEIKSALGNDFELFQEAYGFTDQGNWEGKIVLQRSLDNATLATRFSLEPEEIPKRLAKCHSVLRGIRSERVRPGTNDKVLTSWNGLMLAALAEAARAFEGSDDGKKYLDLAKRNAQFLLTCLRPKGDLRRSWRNGKTTSQVFLEDYAALGLGLLELYQTEFNSIWFTSAIELAEEMIARFQDISGGFFDTPINAGALPMRPQNFQDNATPSGNAQACELLLKLSAYTERGQWRELAEKSLMKVSAVAVRHPTVYSRWLSNADFSVGPVRQVALLGDIHSRGLQNMLQVVRSAFRPNTITAYAPYPPEKEAPDLLQHRDLVAEGPTAFVCEQFVCNLPVTQASELRRQLDK